MRNLDLAALRSLVAIADTQGVTRAAQRVNLTQSAVSMQIKRLEESFGTCLLQRNGRQVELTLAGEQLVSYARRLLALNDETWNRFAHQTCQCEIVFGVPCDIVYPNVPLILRQFSHQHPKVKVHFVSSLAKRLKAQFVRGEIDLILVHEEQLDAGGQTVMQDDIRWLGAANGKAYLRRPLPVAFRTEYACKAVMARALDRGRVSWESAGDFESETAVAAMVAGDLAVTPYGGKPVSPGLTILPEGALPAIDPLQVNMYSNTSREPQPIEALADLVRSHYGNPEGLRKLA